MVLPSILPSHQALVRAICDGDGLITVPTPDGPEHYACLGCTGCTSRPVATPAPAHLDLAALLKAIRAAESREALAVLWAANQDAWTPWCTKVGQARLAALGLA